MARQTSAPVSPSSEDRPYQSLYRRFRPARFAAVRGQDHVTLALRNAVRDGHTTHAYLFSGPRGTGKTSTARILAMALNCVAPGDGEPCGQCESCISIAEGSSFDVHELDAASNNGVDAMRDLVARASLATPGRWKVYIVDEVHMLSAAASNALLKTLEEPPSHVVFVLATTDPQKVLATLRSRTQHFEFHLIEESELTELVTDIVKQESIEADDGAIATVVRRARGSARDALSALDQIAAGATAADDSEVMAALVEAIATSDLKGVLVALDTAVRQGRDPSQLAIDIVERLRSDFLVIVGARSEVASIAVTDPPDTLTELGAARCVRAMDLVGTASVAMREAPEPRVSLEVALIRAARPESDTLPEAVIDRLERLERRLDSLAVAAPTRTEPPATRRPPEPPAKQGRETSAVPPAPQPAPAPPAAGRPAAVAEPAGGELDEAPSRDDLVSAWGDEVLPKLRPKLRAIFQAGRFVQSEGNDAVLALPNQAHIDHATPLCNEVAEALGRHFGRRFGLRLIADPATASKRSPRGSDPDGEGGDGSPQPDEAELIAEARAGTAAGEEAVNVSGLDLLEDRLKAAFPGAEEV